MPRTTESPATGSSSRLPSLTGIRFIAAVLVFLHHGIWVNVFSDQDVVSFYRDLFINAGHVGVSFFFILSGFVLTWSARKKDTFGRYLRRRVAKVYPNHVVTFVAALLLLSTATQWHQAVPNLLLIQSWFPRYDVLFSVNPPSWSLACEVLFYLSFPLLLRWVNKIRVERLWWWAGGTVAAVFAVAVFAQFVLPADPAMPDGQPIGLYQFWFVYAFPPVRALDFLLGILLAKLVMNGRWIRVGVGPAALLFLACYALAGELPYVYGLNAATIIPLALLVPAAAVADTEGRRTFLRGRVATWLGEVSYAFYLVHVVVLIWVRGKLGHPQGWDVATGILLLAGGLVLSLLVAWALHAWVENPAMRRWSKPKADRAAAHRTPGTAAGSGAESGAGSGSGAGSDDAGSGSAREPARTV
ncbi:acyltransferase family protein [Streptomyces sp. NPDC020858]|uniref:acyltransferase family protein n=1 Tax=Streptomyces sp. NPDC020858 TaxID=3365097 RepID=UPI0037B1C215